MWRRLPVWFRAVVAAFLVTGVPTLVWAVLAAVNLRLTPGVPYAAGIMALLLWVYWRYVGGEGPPRRFAEYRKQHRRAAAVAPQVWPLALLAGGTGVAAVWALFMALRGVLQVPNPPGAMTQFPIPTILALIVMGSAVAAVTEEAGFRGYMQLAMERAYGPGIAIAVTGLLFTALHLTHGARILPFLPFFLAAAVIYGLLTWLTGSILPSMALHFVGDVMLFGMRYAAVRQGIVGGTATDAVSAVPLVVAAVFAVASVLAFRLLAREARALPPAGAVAAFGS